MPPDRERALVARVGRHADASAFGELYDFYLPRIYGFILRRVRDRAMAEDLTATTFERALAALRGGRFRNDAFGGWLYRVAANAIVDQHRASSRVLSLDGTDADASPDASVDAAADSAADALAAALDRDELRQAMGRISETHRRVLALRFFDDLGPEEASAVLGCSRRTFAVKLHRALGALRDAMSVASSELPRATEITDAA